MSDVLDDRKRRKTLEKLVTVCEAWKRKHSPGCPEALLQVDSIHDDLPELVEAIGDVLGWWKDAS